VETYLALHLVLPDEVVYAPEIFHGPLYLGEAHTQHAVFDRESSQAGQLGKP
jgi:hypothetical protein